MKLFILISTLIVIAQAQFGRFGPGGVGGFGPGFGGRFGGVGGFGRGVFAAPAVAVAPVIAAPVIAAPIARVLPIGGFGPVGMVGLGGFPRAVVVARPRLIVGRCTYITISQSN